MWIIHLISNFTNKNFRVYAFFIFGVLLSKLFNYLFNIINMSLDINIIYIRMLLLYNIFKNRKFLHFLNNFFNLII